MERLMQKYLEHRKTIGITGIKQEKSRLRKFKQFLDTQNLTADQVTTVELKIYRDSLSALNPSSAELLWYTVGSFYKYCQVCGYLPRNPFQDLKRESIAVKEPTHLGKLIENYLEYRKMLGLSAHTIKGERQSLNKFETFLTGRELNLDQATASVLKDYRDSMQGLKTATILYYLLAVKRFCSYLYRNHLILLDPCRNFELPFKKRRLPDNIPTVRQMKQILESIDLTTGTGLRDRAILELVYSTGLRVTEASLLNLDDLDLKNRLLKVRGKGGKDRIVPFGKTAAFYLKLYLKTRRNLRNPAIFQAVQGKRLGRSGMEAVFWTHAGKFGWKFRFHSLRHACALHMLQNKAGIRHIQELLGHNCIRSTQIYTQLLPLDLKKAHNRYHPRNKEVRHG
ncbi:MAG: tyrosine-type recombinase/integrase [Bacillota bacterium]